MKDCFEIIKDHTEFAELFAEARGDNAKMREVASKALENLHGDLNKLKATLGKPVQPYTPVDRTADIEKKKAEYQNKIDELSTPKGNTSNVVIDEPNKSGESIPLKEAGSGGVEGDVEVQYNERKKSIEDKLNQQLEDNKDRLDDIEDKGGTKTVRQKIYQEHTNEMVKLEKWKMKEDLKNEKNDTNLSADKTKKSNDNLLTDDEIFDKLDFGDDKVFVDKLLNKGSSKSEILKTSFGKDALDKEPSLRMNAERNRIADKIEAETDPLKKLAMLINPEAWEQTHSSLLGGDFGTNRHHATNQDKVPLQIVKGEQPQKRFYDDYINSLRKSGNNDAADYLESLYNKQQENGWGNAIEGSVWATPKGNTSNVVIDEPNKSGESIPLKEADEKQATEIPNKKEGDSITESETDKATLETEAGEGGKEPPRNTDFDKMTSSIPNSGEIKKYLSGDTIKKYEKDAEGNQVELRNNQEIVAMELDAALKHGLDTIEKAKEIFGEAYIEKTIDYIGKENLAPENKALLYVSLENEVAKRVQLEPDNLGLKKLQDLVREKSQAYLRSNSLAINMGRLRKFAETGYDITKVTDRFFSSKEMEEKGEIEKLVQADAETIQKQYEDNVQESAAPDMALEAKIKEGVDAEIAKLYEALPKEKKTAVDKAIAALDKVHEKLRGKAYESTLGIPIAIIDMGVVTIRAALKAGVQAAKAVEMGIEKIKEKYGKEWGNENVFRKDYLDGLKEQGVLDAQQRRQAEKEYRMLETERNRQLARVTDLTEKLKTLQGGERPATNPKEVKPDVPEIEALKQKVKEETKKLNALDAQQRRIDGLETELERLQQRLPKEKSESVKREISEKEQELKGKIEAEKDIIRKENKENNQLRLSDAKDAVRQRIEKIKTEIANKERELKEKNKPLNEDLELARLREIEKQITELRDKYLPEEKDPYEAEKQRERVKDKLVADIITLNEQINAGERNKATDKPNYENDAEINKLKKIREDKRAVLNEIDPLAAPKEKTTAERKVDAENNLQKRIDAIREEILSGERDLKQSKDKLQGKKLDQLREQKKSLEALRDKYLPKDKDPYADKKAAKAVEDKLVKENIELNRQIAKGEKDIKEGKESPESQNINKLKAERDGRKEILEALDPTPKIYAENALIEQGFGKTIKVKTKNGVEEKQILDWTKLAGSERSIDKISENVAKALEKSGFNEQQLNRMQDAFIKEYNEISANVIQKGQNVIAARNKTTVTPDQKSAAKKLVEMYNYGLFDKNLAEYEVALSRTIGINKLNESRLNEAIVLGKAAATLFESKFQGNRLSEKYIRAGIQVIDNHMRNLLHAEAKEHGSTALKIADAAQMYMDLTQRMALNSLKQATENPLSGKMESLFSAIGYSGSVPKSLNAKSRKIARDIYKEMVLQKGQGYGESQSAFINKGNVEMEIDRMSDNKLLQGILSTAIGKTTLDAVDSMYKSKITQQKFTYNLIHTLMSDRLVDGKIQKGMSKQEARDYVAEKLTGQSFEEAQKTSREIIEKINKEAGKKIFNDSPVFVDRLANDIVNAALVNGEKISAEMVDASYSAAYKAAGRGLGHVANNWISQQVGSKSGQMETAYNKAIKEKDYKRAATLRWESMVFRNILNPFVGGGSNWVVLKAEKTGLGLVSGLYSMYKRGGKADLTTKEGIANLENVMYENMMAKDKMIRGAVGGAVTAIAALTMAGITSDDDYKKWRGKNMWAAKYLDLVTPEIILGKFAQESDSMLKYIKAFMNKNDFMDKGTNAIKAGADAVQGKTTAAAGFGKVAGSIFGAPLPWRLIRDGDQLLTGAMGGEPYKVNNKPPKTFFEGFIKGGMSDYIMARKKGEKQSIRPAGY